MNRSKVYFRRRTGYTQCTLQRPNYCKLIHLRQFFIAMQYLECIAEKVERILESKIFIKLTNDTARIKLIAAKRLFSNTY